MRARSAVGSIVIVSAIVIVWGGLACNSSDDYPDPPPVAGRLQAHALVGRLQDRALAFYAEHVADLLRTQHETRIVGSRERLVIYLPEASVATGTATVRDGCIGATDPAICPPADQTFRSRFEIDLEQLATAASGRFLVGVLAQEAEITFSTLDLFTDLALRVDQGANPPVVCRVADADPLLAAARLDTIGFHLTATTDAAGLLVVAADPTTYALATFDLGALSRLTVTPCNDAFGGCDDPLCAVGDCVGVCRSGQGIFAVDPLRDTILDPLVGEGIAVAFDAGAATSVGAVTDVLLDFSNTFAADATIYWAPPQRLGGNLHLGVLRGSPLMELSGPSGWRGVTLALDVGSFGEQSAPCAPTVVIPAFGVAQGPVPYFDGVIDVEDPRTGQLHTEAYHVVVNIAQSSVEQLGMSLLQMGGLCPRLPPSAVGALTGIAPGLASLATWIPEVGSLGNGPLTFDLHATGPARVRFGSGALTGYDDEGVPIYDSLLAVSLGDVGLSIYAELDGSKTRLGTVAADVDFGLDLVRAPDNHLEVAVDRVTVANVALVATELPGIDLTPAAAPLLRALIEGALAAAPRIDLDLSAYMAAAIGNGATVYQRINAVRREGLSDGGYLSAYITFCDDADLADPQIPACSVPWDEKAAPVPARPPRLARRVGTTVIELDVDGTREYQVRVDAGPWSRFFAPIEMLVVRSERLAMPGRHRIVLRSRPPGSYWARRDEPRPLAVTTP